jgi:hypothetical protein
MLYEVSVFMTSKCSIYPEMEFDIEIGIIYYPLNLINNGGNPMQAYCMKCRTKREMKDAKNITMKNGRPATQGTCPVCGTKLFRIGRS